MVTHGREIRDMRLNRRHNIIFTKVKCLRSMCQVTKMNRVFRKVFEWFRYVFRLNGEQIIKIVYKVARWSKKGLHRELTETEGWKGLVCI